MNISFLTPLRHAAPLAALALLPLLPQTTLADAVGKRYTSMAAGDLDGDGVLDRVFGYPTANGTEGKVVVVYGNETIEIWNRDVPGILGSDAVGNYLGDSIAVADFDGDGYDDLAIGVPGDDTSAGTNVGSITVVYGSSAGLSNIADQLITQNTRASAAARRATTTTASSSRLATSTATATPTSSSASRRRTSRAASTVAPSMSSTAAPAASAASTTGFTRTPPTSPVPSSPTIASGQPSPPATTPATPTAATPATI